MLIKFHLKLLLELNCRLKKDGGPLIESLIFQQEDLMNTREKF